MSSFNVAARLLYRGLQQHLAASFTPHAPAAGRAPVTGFASAACFHAPVHKYARVKLKPRERLAKDNKTDKADHEDRARNQNAAPAHGARNPTPERTMGVGFGAAAAALRGARIGSESSWYARKLPREGERGVWSGDRGESLWYSSHPDVTSVTKGAGVRFVNSYPDFRPWAMADLTFEQGTLTGRSSDAHRADTQWALKWQLDAHEARHLRKKEYWVWHHVEDCRTMLLLPGLLHGNIPHSGGATLLRHGCRDTTSPCLVS